nr:thioesterase family protein [Sphingobium sp. Sx8-8]
MARSPWEKGKQNGVALGGLATFLMEDVPTPAPMMTTRLTIDILGAAPHAPTEGQVRIVRDGMRLQLVESQLLVEGRTVARATALRVRLAESPVYGDTQSYPPPESVEPSPFMDARAFGGTMETRLVSGGLREPGPGVLWVRFNHEHVAGTPLSPLLRVTSLADFGGGLGSEVSIDQWTYMNLDISVHLLRPPVGEWMLADASTSSAGRGVGRSDMIIADRDGPFARAHQMLFIAPR